MPGFFEKWMKDIKDAQADNGSVQGVAPAYWTRNPADPTWGMAYIMIPFELYLYYGDTRVLQYHYDSMKKYLDFLSSNYSTGYLVQLNLNGDYCAPSHIRPPETPGELISSWAFYMDALTVSKIVTILGNEFDSKKYSLLALNIKDAFNARFSQKRWDRGKDFQKESYGDTQTSNLLPLSSEIVPEDSLADVLESLLLNISRHHDNHLDTGIIGTKFLFSVLSQSDYEDIAYEIATKRSYPSYGYMIREGATTLWERWEYVTSSVLSSHNHIMFGSIDAWFYKSLAGITPDESRPGFEHFLVKPRVPEGLSNASASLQTIRGLITTDWQKTHNGITLNIRVPANTFCTVHVPKLQFKGPNLHLSEDGIAIFERGVAQKLPDGINGVTNEGKFFVCEIGSGSYSFTLEA
jgi:alpha-L-rhamnosidase